jgi:hypothetical protein
VEELGQLHVVLIPDQDLPYFYTATPDESFALEAKITSRTVNVPGGTGVATAVGRPFTDLSEGLDATTGLTGGESVQSALNAARETLQPADLAGPANANADNTGPLCGAIGSANLALLGITALTLRLRGRGRLAR